MEDLVEREFSGFLEQGQNSDNRVQKQAKAMKTNNVGLVGAVVPSYIRIG